MIAGRHPWADEPVGSDRAADRLVIRRAPGARPGGVGRSGPPWGGGPVRHAAAADGHLRSLAPLLLWAACLAGGLAALHWLGRTPLASPPLVEPLDWWSWAQRATTDELAFNVLRLLALALCWYLAGVTTIGVVARLARLAGAVRVADAMTADPLRRLLQSSLGAVLATSTALSAPGTALAPAQQLGADAAPRGDEPSSPPLPSLRSEEDLRASRVSVHDGWAHLLGPSVRTADAGSASAREAARGPLGDGRVPERRGGAPASEDDSWVVAPGEHFWSIAAAVVANDPDAPTTGMTRDDGEGEVAAYWVRLVESNRDRLVDPANADLLVPGQVLLLPARAAR